jgi:hypothetical protein
VIFFSPEEYPVRTAIANKNAVQNNNTAERFFSIALCLRAI